MKMTPEARNYLKELLLKHEGFRQFPYRCTAGKLTIGIGRNLDANGVSLDEAYFLLGNDIRSNERELTKICPVYNKMNDARKVALLNMAYNLGVSKFMQFRKMLEALDKEDYNLAAKEALNSKWAKQIGHRANEIAYLIEEGVIHG
jgi:lysozyme